MPLLNNKQFSVCTFEVLVSGVSFNCVTTEINFTAIPFSVIKASFIEKVPRPATRVL
jgi:hypothetical protein